MRNTEIDRAIHGEPRDFCPEDALRCHGHSSNPKEKVQRKTGGSGYYPVERANQFFSRNFGC